MVIILYDFKAGYPDPRGPICFNCAEHATTNDCNKITMCFNCAEHATANDCNKITMCSQDQVQTHEMVL